MSINAMIERGRYSFSFRFFRRSRAGWITLIELEVYCALLATFTGACCLLVRSTFDSCRTGCVEMTRAAAARKLFVEIEAAAACGRSFSVAADGRETRLAGAGCKTLFSIDKAGRLKISFNPAPPRRSKEPVKEYRLALSPGGGHGG